MKTYSFKTIKGYPVVFKELPAGLSMRVEGPVPMLHSEGGNTTTTVALYGGQQVSVGRSLNCTSPLLPDLMVERIREFSDGSFLLTFTPNQATAQQDGPPSQDSQ